MKLKQLTKIGILIFGISMFFTACEKESSDEIITQEKFDAPSIELAKQFVNSNSNTSNPNISFRSSSSDLTSVTYWEGSKTKKYKETEEQNVDILYTPIYVNSTRTDIKGFIASTEQNGIVDAKKFYVLYKSNDLSNGLNAYILIYGLDGYIQQAYNFVNGQQVPLEVSEKNNVANKSSGECDGNISTMTDDDFENWMANCAFNTLDQVTVTAVLSNESGNNSGSTSAFNDWNSWINVHIPAVTNPNSNYNYNSGNTNNAPWHTPNITVANAVSISSILNAAYNSLIANWLKEMEKSNQQILNNIANYLNANRVANPFSDFNFSQIQPEQFPVSDEAIQYVNDLIEFLDSNTNSSSEIEVDLTDPEDLSEYILENVPPDCESFEFYQVGGNNWQCSAVVGVNELFTIFNWDCTAWNIPFFIQPIYFQLPVNFNYPMNSGSTKLEAAIRLHDAFKAFDNWYDEHGCEDNQATAVEQVLLDYMKDEFEEVGGNVTMDQPLGFTGETTAYKSKWFGYGNCN